MGSYGGKVAGEISDDYPAAGLRRLLTDNAPIVSFGRRIGIRRFLQAQVALRRLNPGK